MRPLQQGSDERVAPGFDLVFHAKDVLPLAPLFGGRRDGQKMLRATVAGERDGLMLSAMKAHKLAQLIYSMLTKGEKYTDQGQAYYEERYRERVLRQLRLRANKLGMQLVAAEQPA